MFFSEIFSFPTNFFSGWNQQIVAFTKLEFYVTNQNYYEIKNNLKATFIVKSIGPRP